MNSLGAPKSLTGTGTATRGCADHHGLGQHQDLQFLSQFCHLVVLIRPCCAGIVVLAPLLELRAPGEDTGTVPTPPPSRPWQGKATCKQRNNGGVGLSLTLIISN